MNTLEERMALRNLTTLRAAQNTHDNASEPECNNDTAELTEWATHLTILADDIYNTIGWAERAIGEGRNADARALLADAARLLGDGQ
jgi:hypothetical protein